MLTVAGIAVGSLVAYAIYFDYRRRTDVNFRKQLRTWFFVTAAGFWRCSSYALFQGKDKKRVAKSQTSSEASASSGGVEESDLKNALEQVRKEEVPATAEEKEGYFMSQVAMGEQLCARGLS